MTEKDFGIILKDVRKHFKKDYEVSKVLSSLDNTEENREILRCCLSIRTYKDKVKWNMQGIFRKWKVL